MQFGNLGRICSSQHFERQHQELPGKNNSFLPPVIANICNCTKRPINWITVQLKRNAWDGNPRWCKTVPFTLDVCKTTQHHIKKRKHNPTLMLRWCCWRTCSVCTSEPRHRQAETSTRLGKMQDFPYPLRPSLDKDAQPPCAARHRRWARRHKHAHGLTYQKRRLRPRCTTARRPLPQLIRYSPLAVSEGDPASCARLCIHSVTMRAARGSSTAQARVRGDGPAASF